MIITRVCYVNASRRARLKVTRNHLFMRPTPLPRPRLLNAAVAAAAAAAAAAFSQMSA